jgi:hypothetical protein
LNIDVPTELIPGATLARPRRTRLAIT